MNNNTLLYGILGIGCGGVIGAAIVSPTSLPAFISAAGGVLAGTSITMEYKRKTETELEESIKVAKNFNHFYELNQGLLSPQQLGVSSNISLDKAETFLDALSASQGGQRIETEEGAVYKFPHPKNILDRLADNATAWATAQKQALEQENLALKQQLNLFQAVINSAKGAQERVPIQAPSIASIPDPSTLNKSKENIDAWSNLL
jgi:hypothetical protein